MAPKTRLEAYTRHYSIQDESGLGLDQLRNRRTDQRTTTPSFDVSARIERGKVKVLENKTKNVYPHMELWLALL